jgi:hypothetical protein
MSLASAPERTCPKYLPAISKISFPVVPPPSFPLPETEVTLGISHAEQIPSESLPHPVRDDPVWQGKHAN